MTGEAIEVEGVVVRFRPFIDRKPTLRRSLARVRQRERAEVVALDGVSFNVGRGEAFGIIGGNGAGKSTLLRVMAGTLRPNEGTVRLRGTISTLLQLGVGFNTELSGRRNVYLGGLAAGLQKYQIDKLYEEIVAFAELEEAIDRPVKTYSSGMFSRLAFSVSMALEPDILFLDEVLSVGDERFREKGMVRMRALLEQAGTIIYVSHSLATVTEFCDRVLWLEHGRVVAIGSAAQVVEAYRSGTSAAVAGGGKG